MNQKKCPKCGELNPAETVMCWACYTPFSGSAGVAPAQVRSAPASTATHSSSSEKPKKAAEPWQLGVIGLGLLIAVGMGVRSMLGSTGTEDTAPTYTAPATAPAVISGTNAAPVVDNSPAAAAIVPSPPPPPGQSLFSIKVSPRRGLPWGTMAIVPTQGNVSAQVAASMAAAARQQAAVGGNWDGLYVYVFADDATAAKFSAYQKEREGQPLGRRDFDALRNLWPQTLVRYEYSRGFEAVRYPSTNSSAWWYGNSRYRRARS